MNINLKTINFPLTLENVCEVRHNIILFTTINAHSFNVAKKDKYFAEALLHSDVLLPDGISIVLAKRLLYGEKIFKIAGADLFKWEMDRLEYNYIKNINLFNSDEVKAPTALFIGSSDSVLAKIKTRASYDYPNVIIKTYSPPYKKSFNKEDNDAMINLINIIKPDVLFVGMTAPKQEKWAYSLISNSCINIDPKSNNGNSNEMHICCIGAVFDFYAGTTNRSPNIFIKLGLEWLYRLIKEPRRMWRRYLIGNVRFIWLVLNEKINN